MGTRFIAVVIFLFFFLTRSAAGVHQRVWASEHGK